MTSVGVRTASTCAIGLCAAILSGSEPVYPSEKNQPMSEVPTKLTGSR